LTQINNILFETNKKFPEFTTVVDIAKEYGPGKTHENRPIYAIKISGKETQDPKEKPSILILSAHHCREIVTPEIGLYAIKTLTEGYKKDPKITKILNTYNVWVVPILNVDGLEYTWKVNNMWRKNRKPHRTGAIGVDLNRNYDLDWYKCGKKKFKIHLEGGSTAPRSEVVRMKNLIFFQVQRRRTFLRS
jgi:carboxypeptidase T